MKIGIDLREVQDFPTGIGRVFKGLLYGLKRTASKHTFSLILNEKNPAFIKNELKGLPSNFDVVRVRSKTKTISQFVTFPLSILHYPFSILITSPYGYSPLIKTPVALIILDQIYHHYPDHASLKARIYMNFVEKLAANKSNLIITDSNDAKRDIIRFLGVGKKKVKVIHLAADPVFTRQAASGKRCEAFIKKYSITKPYIIFVGNRRPHKNLITLLNAFREVRGDIDLQLVIVGDDDTKKVRGQTLKFLIDNCQLSVGEDVILTGHISDEELAFLYSEALCLVHPALIEGFGLTPLEAMACGCPVIVSNTSSIPEVVKDAGILINPKKGNEIADSIKLIAKNTDLREGLIEKGYRRVNDFSWEKTASRTLEVLENTFGY